MVDERNVTPGQLVAAAHLMEECSEVQKALAKFIRHGPRPFWNGVQYDNLRDVEFEFSDVVSAMHRFRHSLDRGNGSDIFDQPASSLGVDAKQMRDAWNVARFDRPSDRPVLTPEGIPHDDDDHGGTPHD